MAFPTVSARATGSESTAVTSHSITLPTHSVGQMLVVLFDATSVTHTTLTVNGASSSASWVHLGARNDATRNTLHVFWKIADSTSETLTLTTSGGERSAHVSYAVSDANWINGTMETLSTGANPNPPSHTEDASRDYLWIACAASGAGAVTASAAPTNYTNLQTATGSTNCGISTAERTVTATTEDPGTFTASSDEFVVATLAIGNRGTNTPRIKIRDFGIAGSQSGWENIEVSSTNVNVTDSVIADTNFDVDGIKRRVIRADLFHNAIAAGSSTHYLRWQGTFEDLGIEPGRTITGYDDITVKTKAIVEDGPASSHTMSATFSSLQIIDPTTRTLISDVGGDVSGASPITGSITTTSNDPAVTGLSIASDTSIEIRLNMSFSSSAASATGSTGDMDLGDLQFDVTLQSTTGGDYASTTTATSTVTPTLHVSRNMVAAPSATSTVSSHYNTGRPTVVNTPTEGVSGSVTTTHTIGSLPAHSVGDLLMVFVGVGDNSNIVSSTTAITNGWRVNRMITLASTDASCVVIYKWAESTSETPPGFTTQSNETSNWIAYVIEDADNVFFAANDDIFGVNVDYAEVTFDRQRSGLAIAAAATVQDTVINTLPTGYTDKYEYVQGVGNLATITTCQKNIAQQTSEQPTGATWTVTSAAEAGATITAFIFSHAHETSVANFEKRWNFSDPSREVTQNGGGTGEGILDLDWTPSGTAGYTTVETAGTGSYTGASGTSPRFNDGFFYSIHIGGTATDPPGTVSFTHTTTFEDLGVPAGYTVISARATVAWVYEDLGGGWGPSFEYFLGTSGGGAALTLQHGAATIDLIPQVAPGLGVGISSGSPWEIVEGNNIALNRPSSDSVTLTLNAEMSDFQTVPPPDIWIDDLSLYIVAVKDPVLFASTVSATSSVTPSAVKTIAYNSTTAATLAFPRAQLAGPQRIAATTTATAVVTPALDGGRDFITSVAATSVVTPNEFDDWPYLVGSTSGSEFIAGGTVGLGQYTVSCTLPAHQVGDFLVVTLAWKDDAGVSQTTHQQYPSSGWLPLTGFGGHDDGTFYYKIATSGTETFNFIVDIQDVGHAFNLAWTSTVIRNANYAEGYWTRSETPPYTSLTINTRSPRNALVLQGFSDRTAAADQSTPSLPSQPTNTAGFEQEGLVGVNDGTYAVDGLQLTTALNWSKAVDPTPQISTATWSPGVVDADAELFVLHFSKAKSLAKGAGSLSHNHRWQFGVDAFRSNLGDDVVANNPDPEDYGWTWLPQGVGTQTADVITGNPGVGVSEDNVTGKLQLSTDTNGVDSAWEWSGTLEDLGWPSGMLVTSLDTAAITSKRSTATTLIGDTQSGSAFQLVVTQVTGNKVYNLVDNVPVGSGEITWTDIPDTIIPFFTTDPIKLYLYLEVDNGTAGSADWYGARFEGTYENANSAFVPGPQEVAIERGDITYAIQIEIPTNEIAVEAYDVTPGKGKDIPLQEVAVEAFDIKTITVNYAAENIAATSSVTPTLQVTRTFDTAINAVTDVGGNIVEGLRFVSATAATSVLGPNPSLEVDRPLISTTAAASLLTTQIFVAKQFVSTTTATSALTVAPFERAVDKIATVTAASTSTGILERAVPLAAENIAASSTVAGDTFFVVGFATTVNATSAVSGELFTGYETAFGATSSVTPTLQVERTFGGVAIAASTVVNGNIVEDLRFLSVSVVQSAVIEPTNLDRVRGYATTVPATSTVSLTTFDRSVKYTSLIAATSFVDDTVLAIITNTFNLTYTTGEYFTEVAPCTLQLTSDSYEDVQTITEVLDNVVLGDDGCPDLTRNVFTTDFTEDFD